MIRVILSTDVWLEGGGEYIVAGEVVANDNDESITRRDHVAVFLPRVAKLIKRDLLGARAVVDIQHRRCPVRLLHIGDDRLHLHKGMYLGDIETCQFPEAYCRNLWCFIA